MKNYMLFLTVRVEVESQIESLSETIANFEKQTSYSFSGSQLVKVLETEILFTEIFNPLNK